MKRNLILASQSPRRKELLSLITTDFTVEVADIDEKTIENQILDHHPEKTFLEKATILVEQLAKEKAKKIYNTHPDSIVIGADTVVVHDDQILGKPIDTTEAYEMLRSYFGKSHWVITGVHVQGQTQSHTFSTVSKVEFWDWSKPMEEQVNRYIQSGSPMDKAGAYGIQEMASLWVKAIHGDYPTIIGLPISYLNQVLAEY
ncbi:Maf family protein [Jeotgalibaca sp. A122]|uniref:Maf family protein n=1 Tax=Jeotgalibaca sp. A122 TaxID=3457322 RepID=UPI003FD41C47